MILLLLLIFQKQYLNDQEIERIREAQEIDKRTAVFLRIAERRLDALFGVRSDSRSKEDYGEYPTGSPAELLISYVSVYEELMNNLDDAYERRKGQLLDKAMDMLLKSCNQQKRRLESFRPKTQAEQTSLKKALETLDTVIEGAKAYSSQ
ncbi:MAG: hypothetical protein RMM17_01945 [Acidobacteriota bacterium]|nr:hypothetical protein [Blastocatellia bacterium]MDW8411433.1 hypothetical protein [Acidobacteriota bacterium]